MDDERTKISKDGIATEFLNSSPNLTGTIEEVVAWLNEQKEYHSAKGYTNIRLSLESRQWEEGYEPQLLGDRPATDQEKARRAKKDAEEKAQREEWDRKKLAELKAKYEPKE